jgi:choline dehydrogenase-like flavoprotein
MIDDPIRIGLASGWKVVDAARLAAPRDFTADVVVVGSGAGGGVTAEILAQAGLDVIVVEEGPLLGSSDFHMREREAYPTLYQESAGRQTRDREITILQGRSVGGSTTVNWTSSFRTPPETLAHWTRVHGLKEATLPAMEPWFRRMEERLSIAPWPIAPNENNDVLRRGCEKLGYASGAILRNVKGCRNLGYCGMGCPTNAKQSMLVTTIPAALASGATLVYRARVSRLVAEGDRIAWCEAHGVERNGASAQAHRLRLRARHFVLAAGGIGSPAILLRSAAPDPHLVLGRRTFVHPTVVCAATMADKVSGFYGAPQTIYSDQFQPAAPLDGPIGFKLEAAPTHPIIAGITLPGFGEAHSAWMKSLDRAQVLIALFRDGFHPHSAGGRVLLRGDGSPVLDYPLGDYVREGIRRAYHAMAEIQFAAGAQSVIPMHEHARPAASWPAARQMIAALPMTPMSARVVTAHVMGGCAMGPDPRAAVVDERGRHHHLENLSVHDGSLFPTGLGANPQLSIYAFAARAAGGLSAAVGRPFPTAAWPKRPRSARVQG